MDFRNFNKEPLSLFLFETLIRKRRLLARNGASYIALRQWRKPIKAHQIDALQAIKTDKSPAIVETIAEEIAQQIEKIYGKLFTHVVPIPGGSSGREASLSAAVAEIVAKKLGITLKNILRQPAVNQGKSHPKKSVTLQPYTTTEELSGNILVLDDVASSGRHIELAMQAIKKHSNYCTAVVWVAD